MKISQKGIDLIKKYEGCVLKAYKDPVGVWTIGYGHTKGVKKGDVITQQQAEDLLKQDLATYEAKVDKYNSTYHFNQNQFDALVSFCYNIGNIDQLTAKGTRSIQKIAECIPLYNKAGGKVLAGLTARRNAEKTLFETPVSGENSSSDSKPSNSTSNTEKPANETNSGYVVGRSYTIHVTTALNVRKGAGSNYPLVGYNGLSADAKKHATSTGALRNGTRVTCKEIKTVGNSVWMRIPSGWICAISGNNVYVK